MTTYHAPHFDPTVDEIETLKQLELGEVITLPMRSKTMSPGDCSNGASSPRGRMASWPSPPVAAS